MTALIFVVRLFVVYIIMNYKLIKYETLFYPFTPKSDLLDFTLSNARRFYSSKGDTLGVKGLKTIFLNSFSPKSDLIDFTLSNARRFHSSKGEPLGVKGLNMSQVRHYQGPKKTWYQLASKALKFCLPGEVLVHFFLIKLEDDSLAPLQIGQVRMKFLVP